MAHHVSAPAQREAASIISLVGGASLFICVAWLAQTIAFTGHDVAQATVLWTLMAAGVAGLGCALLFVARFWMEAR